MPISTSLFSTHLVLVPLPYVFADIDGVGEVCHQQSLHSQEFQGVVSAQLFMHGSNRPHVWNGGGYGGYSQVHIPSFLYLFTYRGLTFVTQTVTIGALFPFILLIMCETRESVILRRRAAKLRKEHQSGGTNGKGDRDLFQAPNEIRGRFTAWSEMNRIGFWEAMRTSALRPFSMCFPSLFTSAIATEVKSLRSFPRR